MEEKEWMKAEMKFGIRSLTPFPKPLLVCPLKRIALPPPPEPPFDIETMEPLEVPPHMVWRDDFEGYPMDRWTEAAPAWAAPELDLGDGRRLVLDAGDPFPEEEWAVYQSN